MRLTLTMTDSFTTPDERDVSEQRSTMQNVPPEGGDEHPIRDRECSSSPTQTSGISLSTDSDRAVFLTALEVRQVEADPFLTLTDVIGRAEVAE